VQRNGIYFINFLCLSVLSKDRKRSAFHQSGKTEAEPDLIFEIGTRTATGILKNKFVLGKKFGTRG
jgi:hypothetical protein